MSAPIGSSAGFDAGGFIAGKTRQNLTSCRHHIGVYNKTCAAGVSYDSVMSDSRIPCIAPENSARCRKHALRSEEEARADAIARCNELQTSMERMATARKAINDQRAATQQNTGIVPCPACGGDLHWARAASNGHVHAVCACRFGWME